MKKIAFILVISLLVSTLSPSILVKNNATNPGYDREPNKEYTTQTNSLSIGYHTADAWAVLVGRLIIKSATRLAKIGSKTYKKVPKSKVVNALKNYKGTAYSTGSKKYVITKTDMKHMLERHHPRYWTDSKKNVKKQTFFDSKLSIKDVESIAINVAKQNRSGLSKVSSTGSKQFTGTVDDVKYVMGVEKGHIRQLYPLLK